MKKFAFIFPGQGAQNVGMGKDLYENFEEAKNIFEKADKILGRNISKICFEGPDEELKQTINTQPAILTTSLAAYFALMSQIEITPTYTAGHSLGEYGALCVAGVLNADKAIKLIAKRAELMGNVKGGTMAAVLGLSNEKVEEIVKIATKTAYVGIANFNCPGQVVITGEEAGVAKAEEMLTEAGAKRVIRLAVSGAFHSEKMKKAGDEFEKFVKEFELNEAQIPVITNVDAEITTKAEDFRNKMPKQIYSSVHWTQTIQKMINNGVDTFVEVGPGKVLAGLNKKISSEIKTYNIYDKATIEAFVNDIKNNN